MIWDYIRDFLVEYIFGGWNSSDEQIPCTIGSGNNCLDIEYKISDEVSITLGDWLSTTTTIIIMCAIVLLFALLVRWVFKAVTSAFLLK